MNNKLEYYVAEEENNIKIREYLKNKLNISSRFIKKASIEKKIEVNGIPVKMNYMLKAGDKIEIDLSREESQNIDPEKIDISVIYEDEDVIVVNKPSGMVVHPTKSYQNGTLANALLYYFKEKGENCIVRLVNRLDRDTSGLVLIAKNQFAHMSLARDMELDSFKKEYIAVVMGNLSEKTGIIDMPIYRTGGDSINRVIDERGQRSITHYKVEKGLTNADVLKLRLETGRTHQIRVHLSSIGHPIYGDTLYGGDDLIIKRQALHASSLSFPHPRDGRLIELEIDIPEDIKNLIKTLS
ncbi:23S rRNA pseudouridine1911/1915/1917 synthase [Clostridium acidisoli DSM 12555]|uniref:Pseudouridine synthase n=1 Tax=Clostridium acidisoli DSM 12555 TaxID=1121291 RepID=A0A1W1X589_9CLOT|nr:RluA family pseudouridine synthase [Clostridium acidisoli]SMC19017.1 23S rRNA pseudouridine1911/1915/1917 synthase [Clostridium acidisoli DSM 12555]